MAFMSPKKQEPALAPDARLTAARASRQKTVLGADAEISGDIRSKGEVEIHGAFDGTADCHVLIIAEGAEVRGTIAADSLEVYGVLDGRVRAKTLSIKKSARVSGGVLHQSLAIEAGALIEASVRRFEGEEAKPLPIKGLLSKRSDEDATGGTVEPAERPVAVSA